ncbi:MAG: sugar ABC transporter substrate-binding protein [Oscillospiraceae bacterium]
MKKTLSLIMALVLILSLCTMAACTKEKAAETPAAPTAAPATEAPAAQPEEPEEPEEPEIDLSKTLPCEYVPEKIEAGMEVLLAFVPPTLQDEFMLMLAEGLKKDFADMGMTLNYASSEYDSAKQVEIIENFVTMGCAAIGTIAMDANALKDPMERAREQGCLICFLGTIPQFECPGACNVNVVDSATACYNMAKAWIAENPQCLGSDGKAHVAVSAMTNNPDNKKRSETLRDLVKADADMVLSYWVDKSNSVDEGFTDAQNALLTDAEVRVFLNFSTSSTVGNNNYITGEFPDKLDEFGAFTMGNNNSLDELISQSVKGGPAICRGTIKQGGAEPWKGLEKVITGLLLEGEEQPYIFYEHMWSSTSGDYAFEYDNGVVQ